jgi:hypothetical protein
VIGVFGPVPEWKAGRGKGKSSYDTYTHSLRDQVPCKSICKVTDMEADVDENRKRGEKENTALVWCSDTISQATLIYMMYRSKHPFAYCLSWQKGTENGEKIQISSYAVVHLPCLGL